jgi:predicted transposase YbfD/YdcC
VVVVRSERTLKKTGHTTTESRFYLSSAPPGQSTSEQWLTLIRGHWGGVEIRNHWRRDALMGEDGSRSRNPNLLANLALLRSALLALLADHFPDQSLPEIQESLHSRPGRCLALITQS